jgi:hypothetical protein
MWWSKRGFLMYHTQFVFGDERLGVNSSCCDLTRVVCRAVRCNVPSCTYRPYITDRVERESL